MRKPGIDEIFAVKDMETGMKFFEQYADKWKKTRRDKEEKEIEERKQRQKRLQEENPAGERGEANM